MILNLLTIAVVMCVLWFVFVFLADPNKS